jgi:hypothetical protein
LECGPPLSGNFVAEDENISRNDGNHHPDRFVFGCICRAGKFGYRNACAYCQSPRFGGGWHANDYVIYVINLFVASLLEYVFSRCVLWRGQLSTADDCLVEVIVSRYTWLAVDIAQVTPDYA